MSHRPRTGRDDPWVCFDCGSPWPCPTRQAQPDTARPVEPPTPKAWQDHKAECEPRTRAGRGHLMRHFGGHVMFDEAEWDDYAREIRTIEDEAAALASQPDTARPVDCDHGEVQVHGSRLFCPKCRRWSEWPDTARPVEQTPYCTMDCEPCRDRKDSPHD